jgi:hypothetical protein
MSQDTNCPYCQAEYAIPVEEDDTATIHMQCSNCGGVFEFMPDFGSFSLPDEGRGFAPTRRLGQSIPRQAFPLSEESPSEGGACGVCCCMILITILIFLIDIIPELLFG